MSTLWQSRSSRQKRPLRCRSGSATPRATRLRQSLPRLARRLRLARSLLRASDLFVHQCRQNLPPERWRRPFDHDPLFHEPEKYPLVFEARKAPAAFGQVRADLLIHVRGELTVEKLVELLHGALAGRLVA